jgi:two-component system sensor histidine kinase BaeS
MLANLLTNSIAYTDAPGEIHLTLTQNKKVLHLTLEDTAPTVSEEAMQHLFERFYRAEGSRNRRFGGAGIGLALVQQIVQAHQGDVTVSASQLGGLKFTLTLPQEAYAS